MKVLEVLVDKKPKEPYLCLFAKIKWSSPAVTCKLGGECKGVDKCERLKEADNEQGNSDVQGG